MGSREEILSKLRAAAQPFTDLPPVGDYRPMALVKDKSPAQLVARFKEFAEKISAKVHLAEDNEAGISAVLAAIGEEKKVLAWDFAHIPLEGLAEALAQNGITVAPQRDDTASVGITGVEAGIAGTGSLLMVSGAGKPRAASLLPYTHIAILTQDQIVADFEAWIKQQREKGIEQFRAYSNVFIISGTSRTADIAMEIITGVHGPGALHLIVLPH